MDDENANYNNVVEQLREQFGTAVVPFVAPIKDGNALSGFVDIVNMKAKKISGDKLADCCLLYTSRCV